MDAKDLECEELRQSSMKFKENNELMEEWEDHFKEKEREMD